MLNTAKTMMSLELPSVDFFISMEYPYIGASPDGLISCKCCGEGVCKIKVILCLHVHVHVHCFHLKCLHTSVPMAVEMKSYQW